MYNDWGKYIQSYIELCPIELAGRGRRFKDKLYRSTEEAVNDLYNLIIKEISDTCWYAIFGHSMGALLTYEIYNKIRKNNHKEPNHIFLSGRYPPHIKKESTKLYTLPDNEFIDEINKLGGLSKEVRECKELMSIIIPIMRADYRILDEYNHKDIKENIGCDFTIMSGKYDDGVTEQDIEEWKKYSNKGCSIKVFEGGHFFINENTENVLDVIKNTLIEYLD